jgi:hypothetical protein
VQDKCGSAAAASKPKLLVAQPIVVAAYPRVFDLLTFGSQVSVPSGAWLFFLYYALSQSLRNGACKMNLGQSIEALEGATQPGERQGRCYSKENSCGQ